MQLKARPSCAAQRQGYVHVPTPSEVCANVPALTGHTVPASQSRDVPQEQAPGPCMPGGPFTTPLLQLLVCSSGLCHSFFSFFFYWCKVQLGALTSSGLCTSKKKMSVWDGAVSVQRALQLPWPKAALLSLVAAVWSAVSSAPEQHQQVPPAGAGLGTAAPPW